MGQSSVINLSQESGRFKPRPLKNEKRYLHAFFLIEKRRGHSWIHNLLQMELFC